jgi:hypothetical protein
MNLVRLRSMVGVCFLVALVGVIGSPEAVAAATCSTFDANNTPTTAFRGGEKIVVRGTGFAANSIVLVNLLQGNRTVELDRVRANDLGAFAMTDATVPGSVSDGDAAIRALDARGSATCALTLTAGDGSEGSLGGLFWVWGVGLALFGLVLAMLTYRRWKGARLREAVDSLAWREQYEGRSSGPEHVREPVSVGGPRSMETSPVRGTDPLPSWTPDAMRAGDEVRPSWVADGPRPSWARPDEVRGFDVGGRDVGGGREPRDDVARTWDSDVPSSEEPASSWAPASRAPASPSSADDLSPRSWEAFEPARAAHDDADEDGVSEPWQPGAPRIDEPVADEPAHRPPPQRPMPERPVPARPGTGDVWTLDDGDDLSPIGAPRPFDDRFALDDDERLGRGSDDASGDDPDDDDPAPFRPPAIDEPFASRPDPGRPVVSRPAPQRPDPVAAAEGDDELDAAPSGADPSWDRGEPGAEPFATDPPEPIDTERVASTGWTQEPTDTGSHAPSPTPRTAPPPAPPLAPPVVQPGVQPERDFAAALRDFLDKEDIELDRRSGRADRPAAHRSGGGLLAQDAGRIPQAPVQAVSPALAQEPPQAVERSAPLGPARPVAPRAPGPSVEPHDEPVRPSVSGPAGDPSGSAWRPAAEPVAERGLQPRPVASAAPVEVSPWESPDPQTARAEREAPAGLQAEPPPFDPVQRHQGARAPERREPERAVELEAPRPGWAPGAPEPGVSEPPVLPVGWDDGRLKPPPRTKDAPPRTEDAPQRTEEAPSRASDAIARLRREVRNWKR